MKLVDQYRSEIQQSAAEFDVVEKIHANDLIFDFVLNNNSFPDKSSAIRYYFSDANNSAHKLEHILGSICNLGGKNICLLEFASGYGCVTRHLGKVLPSVRVTSCDIHAEAIDFIEKEIGVEAIISDSTPELLKNPEIFNVVFALSFFSHIPDRNWGRWLAALTEKCIVNGYLIFTTHGLKSKRYFGDPILDDSGYWFHASSEQHDIDTHEYGQTIVSRDYVRRRISDLKNVELVHYEEGGWWGHQDVYVLRKLDKSTAEPLASPQLKTNSKIVSKKVPKVFIHIGHGRTGTTSVQDMFFENKNEFYRKGILYPEAGIPVRNTSLLQTGHHLFSNDLTVPFDEWQKKYLEKKIATLRQEIEAIPSRNVFISSEHLSYADPDVIHLLSSALKGYAVKIIYVVRRQDYIIPSSYLQAVKQGSKVANCSLEEYLDKCGYGFDFLERINPWQQAFGASSINCLLKNEDKNQDIREEILRFLSCNLSVAQLQAGRPNRNLGFDSIDFFRTLDELDISDEKRWKIVEALENAPWIRPATVLPTIEFTNACIKRFKESNAQFSRKFLSNIDEKFFQFE